MPVVDVRHMGMTVRERLMPMRMGMRFLSIPWKVMPVLVMLIMHMAVRMDRRLMGMDVLMLFGQMQPDSACHQRTGEPEAATGRLVQQSQGNSGTDEGGNGKVGPGPGRSQVTQGQNKEDQAESVTAKANGPGKQGSADGRHRHPHRQRDSQIECACDESLDAGDLHGIAGRYPAGKVVVDRPAQAGADDGDGTPWHPELRPLLP